jgi:hypothetical protein
MFRVKVENRKVKAFAAPAETGAFVWQKV